MPLAQTGCCGAQDIQAPWELELVQSQFSFMSGEEKRKYLGLNAQQLWGLGS